MGHVSSPWSLGGAGRLPGFSCWISGRKAFSSYLFHRQWREGVLLGIVRTGPGSFAFGHLYTKILSGRSFLSKRQEELVMDSKAQTL